MKSYCHAAQRSECVYYTSRTSFGKKRHDIWTPNCKGDEDSFRQRTCTWWSPKGLWTNRTYGRLIQSVSTRTYYSFKSQAR